MEELGKRGVGVLKITLEEIYRVSDQKSIDSYKEAPPPAFGSVNNEIIGIDWVRRGSGFKNSSSEKWEQNCGEETLAYGENSCCQAFFQESKDKLAEVQIELYSYILYSYNLFQK